MRWHSWRTVDVLTAVLLLWPVGFAAAAPPPNTAHAVSNASTLVKLLRDDPLLQTSVTIEAVEQPLGDVLTRLRPALKLDLSAAPEVSDQRVTLHIADQPAYVLMEHLLLLFSHDAAHPYGYHWGSLERSAGERPDYELWRDTTAVAQEQAEHDSSRRQLGVILHEMRRQAQIPPQMVTAYKGDTPHLVPDPEDPYNIAFHGLTDTQLEALVNGETVPLDRSLFTSYLEASHVTGIAETSRRKAHSDEMDRLIYGADLHAKPPAPVLPPPLHVPPTPAGIRVVPADQDNEEDRPDQIGKYNLYLPGIMGDNGWHDIDATGAPKDPDPEMAYINLPADAGPRVDLTPYLAAKTVTDQQRGDLGFTLQALAKAAHINIYGESFLRTSARYGVSHTGLTTLQGSVPRLVAQICALWNYHAAPVPGGYLFWSRTWAQDRANDVSERLIVPWRQRLAKNGALSFYDRSEIDAALTWPQVALTLDVALPEAGQDDGPETYHMLNVFGSLTPSEQVQALSPGGLALLAMSARGQAALAHDFQKQLTNLPGDQLTQAVLKFQTEEAPDVNVLRVKMSVEASDQKLLFKIGIIPLKAASTPTLSLVTK